MKLKQTSYEFAVAAARIFAKEGPRVSAIFYDFKKDIFFALPRYVDENFERERKVMQLSIVTPDGRIWCSTKVT